MRLRRLLFDSHGPRPLRLLLVAVALLVGAGVAADSSACRAKWRDSGMASRWGMMTGCQVQVDGNWLPAANYRVGPR